MHAVSGELANTWSGGAEETRVEPRWDSRPFGEGGFHGGTLPCLKFSVIFCESHWMALTPSLVP